MTFTLQNSRIKVAYAKIALAIHIRASHVVSRLGTVHVLIVESLGAIRAAYLQFRRLPSQSSLPVCSLLLLFLFFVCFRYCAWEAAANATRCRKHYERLHKSAVDAQAADESEEEPSSPMSVTTSGSQDLQGCASTSSCSSSSPGPSQQSEACSVSSGGSGNDNSGVRAPFKKPRLCMQQQQAITKFGDRAFQDWQQKHAEGRLMQFQVL